MADLLIGQDPRPVERLYWDMLRRMRQNSGGVSHKAMAGIELALWDIKAKALGVPVYELFGGPMRDRMRLYWSHCGTTRARMGQFLGTPPLKTYDDIAALGREGGKAGIHRAENQHGDPRRSGDRVLSRVRQRDQYHRRRAHGRDPRGDRPLDRHLPRGRRAESGPLPRSELQLPHGGRAADRQAAREVRHAVGRVRQLGSGRAPADQAVDLDAAGLVREPGELAAVPAVSREARGWTWAIIDVPWNGFSQSVQIGRLAEACEINIAPHNYYSHLADLHSLHLCAVLPNVRIMEIDIDDVPWKGRSLRARR